MSRSRQIDIKNPRIVVIGSLNMDLVVEADRAPHRGETVLGKQIHFIPGGKGANQAVAAARLGAHTSMLGAVGEDAFGNQLLAALGREGIDTQTIKKVEQVPTGVAAILLADTDNSIIVIPGANYQCLPADIVQQEDIIAIAEVVLLQLEIPLETVTKAVEVAKKHGKLVILNPAPAQILPPDLLSRVDYLTPNASELALLAGGANPAQSLNQGVDVSLNQGVDVSLNQGVDRLLEEGMDRLLDKGVGTVITTLGGDGVIYKTRGGILQRVPAQKVEAVDTTGAGDAFNAALACGLAEGKELEAALIFASKAAALAVTKLGAQAGMPTREEVENSF